MPLKNDIALRPRFKMEISRYNEAILSDFENEKTTQSEFIITRVDDHVFIKFPNPNFFFFIYPLVVRVMFPKRNNRECSH